MNFVLLSLAVLLQLSTGVFHVTSADNANIILNKHNELRSSVNPTAKNMLRMKWSIPAATNSKNWADHCHFGHSSPSQRTVNGKVCGENLFASTAQTSWDKVIQSWYNEHKDFKYGVGATSPRAVTGHYTQVVWAKTSEVGCASSFCPKSFYKYIYVCQYCPAGNIQGLIRTPYAAGPPCGDCPNACRDRLCTNL